MLARYYGMMETVDRNFGMLMAKLKEWGVEENTLVIYIGTDNGGFAPACEIYNAGMRGSKNTPYEGGTRAPCFCRWPAKFEGGRDCAALSAHIDIFPTLAEIAGVPLTGALAEQVEGRSLLPLMTDPQAEWPDRFLVTHLGRWPHGRAAESKYAGCSIRDSEYSLVNNKELYDLKADPGEATNILAAQPEEAAKLRAAYDRWWNEVQPLLVNENVVGPKMNPFKAMYWAQFGGGPTAAELREMDPTIKGNVK